MIALSSVLSRLEWITTPASGPTNDTKLYCPPATDTSTESAFKRDLFSRSMTVLAAGKAKLQGQSVLLLPGIKEDDYQKILNLLVNDSEQREYFELLHVASAAQLLIRESQMKSNN